MKNNHSLLFALLLLSLFLFLEACHNQDIVSPENELQQENLTDQTETALTYSAMPNNTITLAQFNAWNTAWETHWDDNYISNFTMPLSNLQNLVNTTNVVEARFYLGYSEVDEETHLTLVGVNGDGESMLDENQYIYNYSKVCPPLCSSQASESFSFPPSGLTFEPENTISVATFNTWNADWKSHWDDSYISHFTMPLSNLENLVNTANVEKARLYLGYSSEDESVHLTLVGVDVNGYSMIGANANIYNYSEVCPPHCSKN